MTTVKTKFTQFVKRFKKDEGGTMAALWAVSLSATVFAVGSAYDYSKISTARNLSQDAADMLALTASAYMRDHDGVKPGNADQGFVHGRKYFLDDFDIQIDPYATTYDKRGRLIRSQRPFFRVYYDSPGQGEVRVKVWGKTQPAFMSAMGIKLMDFSTDSVVLYEAVDLKDPASIFLVLDRSGSMSWTDGDGVSRNAELRATVKDFMTSLDTLTENVTTNVLRTAMYPYSSSYDSANDVPPVWRTLTPGEIDKLQASGGTNSEKGMDKARQGMALEDAAHRLEHGNGNPKKFVVLMTDGVNSPNGVDYTRCYPEPAHYHWEDRNGYYNDSHNNSRPSYSFRWNGRRYYSNFQSVYAPAGEWDNCAETSTHDAATLADCTSMKNDGVIIYTIGYALGTDSNSTQEDIWEKERAYAMLSSCATSQDNFFDAEDASQLITAFEDIGEDIIAQSIRIRT